jgi:hypothetical protein
MTSISIREFGSLDHDYPVLEVFVGEALAFEIITNKDRSSVQVLESEHNIALHGTEIVRLLEKVLPAWHESLNKRDIARGR